MSEEWRPVKEYEGLYGIARKPRPLAARMNWQNN